MLIYYPNYQKTGTRSLSTQTMLFLETVSIFLIEKIEGCLEKKGAYQFMQGLCAGEKAADAVIQHRRN